MFFGRKIYPPTFTGIQTIKRLTVWMIFILPHLFVLNAKADWKHVTDSLLRVAEYSDDAGKAKLYQKVAKIYYAKRNYPGAYEYFKKSLVYAEKIHDTSLIAKSNNNIAVVLDVTGNYSKAVERYKNALESFIILGDDYHVGCVFNNLGVIYEEMKEPEPALKNYMLALKLKTEAGDTASIAATLNNIGIIYRNFLKNNDSALYYYKKAYNYYRILHKRDGEALCLANIGGIYLERSLPDSALTYFFTAHRFFDSLSDNAGRANVLFMEGNAFRKKKDIYTGKNAL